MVDIANALLRVTPIFNKGDFEKAIGKVDATKSGESAGTTFGSGFSSKASAAFNEVTGKIAKAGVAGFAAIAVASLKMAADFDAGLTTLVTGAGETEKNLGLVGDGIKTIAVQTGTTTKQLIAGMFLIESAGFHGAAGLTVLKAASEGAKVGGADLATVANALTTVMKDYGPAVGTATQAMDGLDAIVSNGKVHLEDLSSSMSRVLPTAAALHVSFADVGGAMATMTSEGTSARLAATGINGVMIALASPSSIAAKAMASVGLSAKQVADTLTHQGLVAALQLVATAARKAGPEGSAAYVTAMKDMLGGTQGLRVGLETTGAHMHTLVADTAAVGAATRSAGKDVTGWALVQKDFNQQMDVLRARLEVAAITLGDKLLPVASQFLSFLMHTQLLVPAVAAILGVVTAALIYQGVQWGITAGKSIAGMASMIAKVVVWAAAQAASIVETIALWILYNTTVESAGLATTLATGGIILILVALAAGAYELYKHWDTVWKFVKTAAMDAFDWLKANWPLVLAILLGPFAVAALEIAKHWDSVKAIFSGFIGWISGLLGSAGSAISAPFITGFRAVEGAWADTTGALAAAWSAVAGFFSGIYQDIVGPFVRAQAFITSSFDGWWASNGAALKEIWHAIWAGMEAVFRGVWDPIVAYVKFEWALLQDIFRVGSSVVGAVWRAGWVAIQAVFHAIWDPIVAYVKLQWLLLQDIFRVGWAVIEAVFRAASAVVTAVWGALWQILRSAFSLAWTTITASVRAGWAVIQAVFSAVAAVVTGIWNVLWAAMLAYLRVVWAAIQALVKVAWDILVGIFDVAIQLLTGHWSKAWADIQQTAQQVWNAIAAFFRTAWAAMQALWATALTQLQNVWASCWSAIKAVISAAWQWIVTAVWNPVKTMLTQTVPGWFDSFASAVNSRLVTPWKNTLQAGWNWIVTNILGPVKAMFTQTLPGWFDSAVGAIGTAWKKVQQIVHDPAAFVVNTILANLVKGFDTVISWVGLKGPAVPHMASKGWKVPGYGGGDKHLALLEGGESVVPKELTPQIAGWLKSKGVPGHQFGWIGDAWNGVKGAVGDVSGFASSLWGKVTDIAGMTAALATGNTGALTADFTKLTGVTIPGSAGAYLSALAKMPPKAVADVVSWIVQHIGPEAGAAIVAYAKTFIGKIPYVWGGTSLSSAGADCSGFTQAIYSHFGIGAPRTSEAQSAWAAKGPPTPGGLAFYHSPAGGADPGHVAIVQDAKNVISQGGGMGPQMMGINAMPLLGTGTPPGGFGAAGSAGQTTPGSMSPAAIASLWTSLGGPAGAAANMAAIAYAESGDVPGVVQSGQPAGLTGYGLYQITPTSGITQNGAYGNLLDAANNTRAAIALYKASGYQPWTSDPVASSLVGSGLSYDGGGLISEPVLGVGRSGQLYGFAQNGAPEWVTPMSQMTGDPGGGNAALLGELRRITAHLAALNDTAAAAPARTGQHVGAAVQAGGANAVFRSRYPAGGI